MPLSTKKLDAVKALLSCPTVAEASRQCGTPEQTLHKWLRNEEFAAELKKGRNASFNRATDALKRYALNAVDALYGLMTAADATPRDRISAADKILSHAIRYVDSNEMQAKLEELRAKVEGLSGKAAEAHA